MLIFVANKLTTSLKYTTLASVKVECFQIINKLQSITLKYRLVNDCYLADSLLIRFGMVQILQLNDFSF